MHRVQRCKNSTSSSRCFLSFNAFSLSSNNSYSSFTAGRLFTAKWPKMRPNCHVLQRMTATARRIKGLIKVISSLGLLNLDVNMTNRRKEYTTPLDGHTCMCSCLSVYPAQLAIVVVSPRLWKLPCCLHRHACWSRFSHRTTCAAHC